MLLKKVAALLLLCLMLAPAAQGVEDVEDVGFAELDAHRPAGRRGSWRGS